MDERMFLYRMESGMTAQYYPGTHATICTLWYSYTEIGMDACTLRRLAACREN